MPGNNNPSTPPSTAAELLEGLNRSQLFAESIFGQIRDQSTPYFGRSATEFAAALVQNRVLTTWQARELLNGRWAFYAGTFRLLECLIETPVGSLFIAEQTGPQRLVFLKMFAVPASSKADLSHAAPGRHLTLASTEHPHLLRCLVVQKRDDVWLQAYQFQEGTPLQLALNMSSTGQQPSARQKSDLTRQLAETIDLMEVEGVVGLALDWALINKQGELLFPVTIGQQYVRPDPHRDLSTPPGSPTHESTLHDNELDQAMSLIIQFARGIGGVEAISGCQTPGEVRHELESDAVRWKPAFELEATQRLISAVNRYLRRGPPIRSIEAFGPEFQYQLASSKLTDDILTKSDCIPTHLGESSLAADSAARHSNIFEPHEALPAPSKPTLVSQLSTAQLAPTTPLSEWALRKSIRRVRAWWVMLLLTGLAMAAFWQWNWHSLTRQAEATTAPSLSPVPMSNEKPNR